MSNREIPVAIVEDTEQIRQHLIEVVMHEPGFRLCGIFSNAEEAMVTIPELKPGVVLMDIGLPGKSGIECVRKLKPQLPATQFLMFTVFEETDQVFDALSAGASGYLLKTAGADEIVSAINDLYEGGSPMSPIIARKVVASFQKIPKGGDHEVLTPKEMEILQLLSQGYLYKEIGEKLHMSLGMVKQQLHKVYERLHVNNRTEAINKVFR
ncbi:MAG: response regulator transcription factor [Flavobacteriales bacterium]|nr:response regulator transcription factor [Flavobacteriales bacterium]